MSADERTATLEEEISRAICAEHWTERTQPNPDYWRVYLPAARAAIRVFEKRAKGASATGKE